MKKIVLLVLFLAVLISGGIYFFSRKAPVLLRQAIERAINKTVKIESIDYQFPWTFELKGFQILETREPFIGEVCFAVDRVLLNVSPLSLSTNELILDNVEITQARIYIRNRNGRLSYALSDAMRQEPLGGSPETKSNGSTSQRLAQMPLSIRRFRLTESQFQFIDYDVQDTGFVIQMNEIEANIKDIAFPFAGSKTIYRVDAKLSQGRDHAPAPFKLNGWTRFKDKETDALFSASDLALSYFSPYLEQVTPAKIEDGSLSSRAALRIHDQTLTSNIDFDVSGLYFKSYEDGDELFGLKADEILSFFKDKTGHLKFQIVLQWNLGDRSIKKREVIRKAIEQSLKKTLFSNVGNILEKTLQKFSNEGMETSKDDLEGTWKKVKKLFR